MTQIYSSWIPALTCLRASAPSPSPQNIRPEPFAQCPLPAIMSHTRRRIIVTGGRVLPRASDLTILDQLRFSPQHRSYEDVRSSPMLDYFLQAMVKKP